MTRAWRETRVPNSENVVEKRAHERFLVNIEAEITLGNDSGECTAIDISKGGAKLRLKQDPFKNVVLSIAPFGEIRGEIIWKDDEYVGIKFHGDQERMAEIIETIVGNSRSR
jgi:hypothetical protein